MGEFREGRDVWSTLIYIMLVMSDFCFVCRVQRNCGSL